jgi:hypothetical protein
LTEIIIIIVAVFVVFVTFLTIISRYKDVLQIKSLLFMVVQAERLLNVYTVVVLLSGLLFKIINI